MQLRREVKETQSITKYTIHSRIGEGGQLRTQISKTEKKQNFLAETRKYLGKIRNFRLVTRNCWGKKLCALKMNTNCREKFTNLGEDFSTDHYVSGPKIDKNETDSR